MGKRRYLTKYLFLNKYDKIIIGDTMKNLQIIDYAITETMKRHPDYAENTHNLLHHNICNPGGIIYRYFSSNNCDARQKVAEVEQQDFLRFVLVETVKIYNAIATYYYENAEIARLSTTEEKMSELLSVFPDYAFIKEMIEFMAYANELDARAKNPDEKINLMIHFKDKQEDLLGLINIVASYRYKRGEQLKKYIDKNGVNPVIIGKYGKVDLISKINSDAKKTQVARNIQINKVAVNKCLMDVLSGSQLKSKHNQYALDGTLYASQDMGRRKNQEDSVIILTHPRNPELKLLAVSDGMGGVDHGEIASQYTVQQLSKWFETISPELFYYPAELQQLLNKKIALISKELYNTYNRDYNGIKAGATIVAGIVTAEETIVSTVGDSRAYALKDGRLQLLTRDESYVWPPNVPANKISKEELDDLRFDRDNNQILRCIGFDISEKYIQSQRINNSSYDKLILLSDGVTDLLTQERIRVLSHSYPPERIAEELVKEAISKNAIRPQGEDDYHRAIINAGKDNATAAVYSRR